MIKHMPSSSSRQITLSHIIIILIHKHRHVMATEQSKAEQQ